MKWTLTTGLPYFKSLVSLFFRQILRRRNGGGLIFLESSCEKEANFHSSSRQAAHLRVEKNEAIFLIMKLGEKLVASIIAWISWSYYFVSKVNRYFVNSKKNILSSPIYYLFIFCCFFLTLSFFFFWNSSSPEVFWISRWFLSLCTYLGTNNL